MKELAKRAELNWAAGDAMQERNRSGRALTVLEKD
jgi:hypothetical protein